MSVTVNPMCQHGWSMVPSCLVKHQSRHCCESSFEIWLTYIVSRLWVKRLLSIMWMDLQSVEGLKNKDWSLLEKKEFYFIYFGLTMWHAGYLFPNQGSNSCLLQWKYGVLNTGLPVNSWEEEILTQDCNIEILSKFPDCLACLILDPRLQCQLLPEFPGCWLALCISDFPAPIIAWVNSWK